MTFNDILDKLFSGKSTSERSVVLNVVGQEVANRDYTNNIKANRKIAREIYHNVNKNYALAGQLVRPIINNNVNFIGIPTLSGNKKNIKVIEDTKIDYRRVHKSAEIDGSVFVWPQWNDKQGKIVNVIIPVDIVNEVFVDPITKEVTGYKLTEQVQYNTAEEINQKVDIVCIVTKDVVVTKISGAINEVVRVKNVFGIIPLVHFSNDKDVLEQFGHSEIEPIEPQLRFYHELTYEAGAAQSRDGHPKMKVTTANPRQWVENNFGEGSYEAIRTGKSKISMDDRDLFVNGEKDDVSYLYLTKTTGDYTPLAETTFINIVQGSETPEINFGANLGTSLASVKEYRPVWIKKIEAKQYERTEPWLQVYDIILRIHNFVTLRSLKNDITITWPTPNFASVMEQSEIIKGFATAIEKLLASSVVSKEEVYNSMKEMDVLELFETYQSHKVEVDKEVVERDKKAKELADSTKENTDTETDKTDESDTEDVED